MASREQAMSLLSAANNHGDLAVKVSSFRQAKDILLSVEPALAADLFPYLLELQYSPEPLVRKLLLEILEEISWKGMEHLPVLVPIVVSFLGDADYKIVRQSIVIGTHLFCGVLEEMVVQFNRRNKVERWLDELWTWLLRFKDSVFAIALKPGSVGTRLHALKFLETYVLLFTTEPDNSEFPVTEGRRHVFNISWLVGSYPFLDPVMLRADANRTVDIFLNFLWSPGSLPGSLTIAVVNCLAAIARKRPIHYDTILSAFLDFDPNLHIVKGCHAASIHYSVRTAFLGFLRCTYPDILETRDKIIRALRMMNAGDAADQVIRQVDKMIKNNERVSQEVNFGRDDQQSNQTAAPGDQSKKRYAPVSDELDNGYGVNTKQSRYAAVPSLTKSTKVNDSGQDCVSINGNIPVLDSDLTPAEKMITMIGALLAEGERGAESLELLVSTIHPDLLADIVTVNMKHLPKVLPPVKRPENSVSYHSGPVSSQTQVPPCSQTNAVSPVPPAQALHPTASTAVSSTSDISAANQFSMDPKRDPRRDPRRLDPRRVPTPTGLTSELAVDESGAKQFDAVGSAPFSRPSSMSVALHSESVTTLFASNSKSDDKSIDPLASRTDEANLNYEASGGTEETFPTGDVHASSDHINSPLQPETEDFPSHKLLDPEANYAKQTDEEYDEPPLSPPVESPAATEDNNQLLELPLYVEMTVEQRKIVGELAVERIIESYNHLPGTTCNQIRITLLSRLIALNHLDDDVVSMLQKHIVIDYAQRKGHELVMHILYQLYSLMVQDSVDIFPDAAVSYEKFLLAVAKSLLDTFPASDKSFSRLLGEVPVLPESAFKLLDDLCYLDVVDRQGKEVRDSERVTQGLGAVWGLILGRPNIRLTCLDIVLKCAVHSQDEIRAKAIRLVANKLYQLDYISENIEKFATDMLLKAVNQLSSETELSHSSFVDQRDGEVDNQETSVSGSQVSETGNVETVLKAGVQPVGQSTATMSFPEAQRHISLFFALCTKKPNLLQLVFDVYGRAPKCVKQVIHRHVPIVVRSLGSSFSELLHIMADPPEGCENLLMLVLQILTQETTPSTELIATVKQLFETKLKDAMILIPILSSLSKDEVLPVFPRLVSLPIEKFQMALAHILQGSAHTGPALTPAEVFVAIHDISPEKDGLALKKITDACTACFEQRTVFTQQVLEKALNQMVEQTPLPLLFMRTVIQAIDAFPSLVDFVMEILSKLINRQVWKMPKLWVGFLKCVSQTRPRSFPVLLQLPPLQLESTLNKHSNLRGLLSSYASQPSVKASLPRQTLAVLGLDNGVHTQQPHVSSLNSPNTSPAAQGANLS